MEIPVVNTSNGGNGMIDCNFYDDEYQHLNFDPYGDLKSPPTHELSFSNMFGN